MLRWYSTGEQRVTSKFDTKLSCRSKEICCNFCNAVYIFYPFRISYLLFLSNHISWLATRKFYSPQFVVSALVASNELDTAYETNRTYLISETDITTLNNIRNKNVLKRFSCTIDIFAYLSVSVSFTQDCESARFYGQNLLQTMWALGLTSSYHGIGRPQVAVWTWSIDMANSCDLLIYKADNRQGTILQLVEWVVN